MPESIRLTEALLDQLAAQWRKHDAPIGQRLMGGLSDAEIDALAEPLGLRIPPEARTWWRWHDGAHRAFIVMSGGKAFASLEQCVNKAAQMRAIAREVIRPYRLSAHEADAMARGVWNWDWLPLCEDGLGGMLVISAAIDEPPREICPVRYRSSDAGSDAPVVAPSIGALVRQWIIALQAAAGPYDHSRDLWVLDLKKLPAGYDDRLL